MQVQSVEDAKFHETEGEIIEYRALSGLAVTSLVLGLLSVLALFGTLLLVIPLLGIVAAILAMRAIKSNPTQLTGRGLAMVGVALSVLFGAASPARTISRNLWLESRAQEFADLLFQYLAEGDTYRAHQLTLSPDARLPIDADLESLYSEELKNQLKQVFRAGSAAHKLLELGQNARYQHIETRITPIRTYEDWVNLGYEVTDVRDDTAEPIRLNLLLTRTVSIADNEQWQISTLETE